MPRLFHARLFEERERAAETIFVRQAEMQFLSRCRGVKALAAGASAAMQHDALTTELYDLDLTAAFVKGADDETLLKRVAATLKGENVDINVETARMVLIRAAV